ncbi:MAG: gliding motility-associated C-terminal domain-containing protein, partial [Chitinophagales bacterium]|nr:gliding motility-associated C-terminal domain-containing protein [Chitinophagales bacterium]
GIDLLADTTICLDDTDPIFVSYVDGSAVWSNGDFGQFFLPNSSGDYTVNYTDANACPRSDTINIQLEDCLANCVVTAPTGFTPDASGVNDIFRAIYTCDLSFYELQIYNRFGELVYMTTDPLEGWDGIYKNGNTEIGAYTWYMKYQIEGTNNIEEIKGTITLIR